MIIIIYREYLYDLNKYMESKSKIIVYLITNLYTYSLEKLFQPFFVNTILNTYIWFSSKFHKYFEDDKVDIKKDITK